ncbi:hypothetical protein ACFSTD_05600 [Novosphingobium colocasiae]
MFEEQAKKHNLYPLITWDDVAKGRIHNNGDGRTLADKIKAMHPAEQ